MGLSICCELVELFGSKLEVESKEGDGSLFYFTLKLPIAQEDNNKELVKVDFSGQRILFIENNSVNQRIIIEYLTYWNIDSHNAGDVQTGLQMFEEVAVAGNPYTTVIVEHSLPELSALNIVRKLRDNKNCSSTVFITLLSISKIKDVSNFKDEGYDECLIKPVCTTQIHDVLAFTLLGIETENIFYKVQNLNEFEKILAQALDASASSVLLVEDNETNRILSCAALKRFSIILGIALNGKDAVEKVSEHSFDLIFMDCQMPIMDGYEVTRAIRDFEARTSESGEVALECIDECVPDLILLDMILPGINGLEVCRYLQNNVELRDIPIIFITAVNKTDIVSEAFNEGAVDYVVKPFNKAEILARVKTHLRLSDSQRELKRLNALALDANPLTRLPGNNSINQKLQEIVDKQFDVAVVYADLDNFKPYNDVYGYAKGDDAIRLLAKVLIRYAEKENEDSVNFVGHIGGDDFVLVLPFSEVESIAEKIKLSFDEGVTSLYPEDDLRAGGINTLDRQGKENFFPSAFSEYGRSLYISRKIFSCAADCC